MHDLTAFQRDCLYAIGGMGDPKGTAIKETLDSFYEDGINHSRLYPNLSEFVEKGLISKGNEDDWTNEYQLTDQAVQLLKDRRGWEGQIPNK